MFFTEESVEEEHVYNPGEWLAVPLRAVAKALHVVPLESQSEVFEAIEVERKDEEETYSQSDVSRPSLVQTRDDSLDSLKEPISSSDAEADEKCTQLLYSPPNVVVRRVDNALETFISDTRMVSSKCLSEGPRSAERFVFKILRAADLVIQNPFCRVYVDGELVGITPVRDDCTDPIFGGDTSTFNIEATFSSELSIQILDDRCETPIAEVSLNVSNLVCRNDRGFPNRWVGIDSLQDGLDAGRLEVCLIPSQIASLQGQPSAKILAPGPEMDGTLTSYAVRKLVLTSYAPVTLHVYDVSNDHRIADINYYTKAVGAGGIFHAAVEIYGREFSFGGSQQRNASGIFACPPKRCPMHHYRESIYLGDCSLTKNQVLAIVRAMKPEWMARTYNLFHKNCCFFSREFAIELGVGTIPDWVYKLAITAAPMEQYINDYCKRQGEKRRQQQMDQQKLQTTITQDRMVDHAMAARLQRSYRARISARRTVKTS